MIVAKLSRAEYWTEIDGRGRPAALPPELDGTRLYDVEFLVDGTRVSATPLWSEPAKYLGDIIAQLLRNLAADGERLVVSVRSEPRYSGQVAGRRLELTAQQSLYLDYILGNSSVRFAWLTRSEGEYEEGTILMECRHDQIGDLVTRYWDWHAFAGFAVRRDHVDVSRWLRFEPGSREVAPLGPILDVASCYFEDWSDGNAVRIWTKHLTQRELEERLRLEELRRPPPDMAAPPTSAEAGHQAPYPGGSS